MDTLIIDKIVEQLEGMPQSSQQRVLEFARTVANTIKGVPGSQLLQFAGTISSDDIELMLEAIEDCEQIERNEW